MFVQKKFKCEVLQLKNNNNILKVVAFKENNTGFYRLILRFSV